MYDFVYGHSDFRVVDLIDWKPTLTVLMLRDPVKRLVSEYYYIKRNAFSKLSCKKQLFSKGGSSLDDYCKSLVSRPKLFHIPNFDNFLEDPDYHKKLSKKEKTEFYKPHLDFASEFKSLGLNENSTLEDFVNLHLVRSHDNYMLRVLTRTTVLQSLTQKKPFSFQSDKKASLAKLKYAKKVLQNSAFFGITERYSESMKLLLWSFGFYEEHQSILESIPTSNAGFQNNTPDIPPRVFNLISQVDTYDASLHSFAAKLFDARLQWMSKYNNSFHYLVFLKKSSFPSI